MDKDVRMILSRVKETMDMEDIRKLSILPIHSPEYVYCSKLGIVEEGCDYSAGGVQLELLKELIDDVLDGDWGDDIYEYIDEVLDNLWMIQIEDN